ncbi:Sensor histidine kinase RcsC [compost metagenome]
MGGQLTLESEEGVGTIASLRIPCSVLRVEYDLPLLKGRPVVLDVRDEESRASLGSFATAAGMRLMHEGEADPSGVAIHFVDSDYPEDATEAKRIVEVSTVPKQLGYRVESGVPRLSINPLRWTAFLAATEVLYGSQSALEGASIAEVTRPEVMPAPFLKVLVVEDHPINRELVQQQLRLLGCASSVVENGQEALFALAREKFDLVLTDCHMPIMNGFELTLSIRSSEDMELRNIPVVGVTATTVREELLHCLEVGMNSYVLKPTTLASLRQALVNADEERHHVDEIDSGVAERVKPAIAEGIDWNELEAFLAEMLDNPETREMFIDSLREDRDHLRDGMAKGSVEELRGWCHRSSGAISVFGRESLNAVFAQFREALLGGDMLLIEQRCAAVFEVYEHLLSIFERADAIAENHSR